MCGRKKYREEGCGIFECVATLVYVCDSVLTVRKGSPGLFFPPYCKFLDGRQTPAILIALGSLRWLFQLLSLDTVPLNLSRVKINYSVLYAFTGCSL